MTVVTAWHQYHPVLVFSQRHTLPSVKCDMGLAKEHRPVKLIVGMVTASEELFDGARARLSEVYGPVDHVSPVWPFNFTNYYAEEFGENLLRQFLSFQELMDPTRLPETKLLTNDLERQFTVNGSRQINLDPGYIDLSKLVLATTKNHQHRLYLGQGIYGEVTLRFTRKSFRPWKWTYPDYRSEHYIQYFNLVRRTYLDQLREI
jgi:hypothetical protein